MAQQDPDEPGVFLLRDKETDEPEPFYRTPFAQETMGLTAAQRGTALHTVMQSIRLDKTGSAREVEEELDRLTAQGYLTEPQAQSVSPISVARFFAGDLGRALRENLAGVTVVIVAQRIASVRDADRVAVLSKDGRLGGLAPHEELLESCPLYREICESQMRGREKKSGKEENGHG